ncbi:MAG TPA: Sb-PDE family phosphodiesterase [Syntrophorhabdaceae bacterium]|nr:Sb-PDE family phosphodiesterase [Syntrophorhabdaceae bacterium]
MGRSKRIFSAGRLSLALFLILLTVTTGFGQRKIINLPNIPGYVTLKCDFHLHTVFSDGNVWPIMRIDEAVRDGLDAIAITDHLGAAARKEFIPPDDNAAWKIGEKYAKENNLILIHGTEITGRTMPPGHFNALFIKDASLLPKENIWDSLQAAAQQGAFVQWNHPGWKVQQPDGIPRMYDVHHQLIKSGYLHGIEFFNYMDYYPAVLDMCREHNLAIMGNSDNHTVISEVYPKPQNISRPMTLVMARERTLDSLKEALFAGRTLVWFRDIVAGKEEYAKPFFYQCISVGKPYFQNARSVLFEVTNVCDIPFKLVDGPSKAPSSITLGANSATRIVLGKNVPMPLAYAVKNVLTGEKDVLQIQLKP